MYTYIPESSVGKESTCNAGDPSSIPGSGRSPGGGVGYPLQNSWASLVAQLVKNLPAMWETWVLFLGWENPLEKGKATHSSTLAWRIPWTVQSLESQRVGYDFHFTSLYPISYIYMFTHTHTLFQTLFYYRVSQDTEIVPALYTEGPCARIFLGIGLHTPSLC